MNLSLHKRYLAVGNTAYAARLLEHAQTIADWEMAQPTVPGLRKRLTVL